MPLTIRSVDISKKPTEKTKRDHNLAVLGDLHGSSLKLLHFLLEEIAELEDPEAYQQYVARYQEAYGKLGTEIPLPQLKKSEDATARLILLGDDLGDRGPQDAANLDLFHWMHENELNYSVIFSNHSLYFFEAMQKLQAIIELENYDDEIQQLRDHVHDDMSLGNDQAHSLESMLVLPRVELIKYLKIYNESYLPHVKLLDTSIEQDGTLKIYSHAPINLDVVEMLARGYGVWPEEKSNIHELTRDEVVALTQKLNVAFKANFADIDYELMNAAAGIIDLLKPDLLSVFSGHQFDVNLLKYLKIKKSEYRGMKASETQYIQKILEGFIEKFESKQVAEKELMRYFGLALTSWNRNYDQLLQGENKFKLKDCQVKHVHGHDFSKVQYRIGVQEAADKAYENVYECLDSYCGKGSGAVGPSVENYYKVHPVSYTQEKLLQWQLVQTENNSYELQAEGQRTLKFTNDSYDFESVSLRQKIGEDGNAYNMRIAQSNIALIQSQMKLIIDVKKPQGCTFDPVVSMQAKVEELERMIAIDKTMVNAVAANLKGFVTSKEISGEFIQHLETWNQDSSNIDGFRELFYSQMIASLAEAFHKQEQRSGPKLYSDVMKKIMAGIEDKDFQVKVKQDVKNLLKTDVKYKVSYLDLSEVVFENKFAQHSGANAKGSFAQFFKSMVQNIRNATHVSNDNTFGNKK